MSNQEDGESKALVKAPNLDARRRMLRIKVGQAVTGYLSFVLTGDPFALLMAIWLTLEAVEARRELRGR